MSKLKGNYILMPTYYHNEYLFSEIYLEEITQVPEQAEVLASLNTLKEYRDYADTSNLDAWKNSFVHQVLYALGFSIQAKSENVTMLFTMGNTDKPLSVCYILLPGENLNNTTMGRNWAEKIIRNLSEHKLQWGLLTNGEQWRIYHQDEPTPYETYLEIDLATILADKAREAYQIFHKFLRAENFIAKEDGRCQFDVFKKESQDKIDYIEKELENALKQKEEGGQGVLSSLCMGYVEYLRQIGNPDLEDEGLRRKIYHSAMLYMFRLLFLYYGDARDLLSETNHHLLTNVRQAAYEMVRTGNASEKNYRLWPDLETIFVDIDQTYNGGLFNPHESEFTLFIEESKILDIFLAPAVYHLAFYHEKTGEEKLISYRDMSVRHLGTLYEGLLEHKLYVANEDTEVIVTNDRVRFIPLSRGGHLLPGQYISKGDVYFGTDSSERKATGSYYTPEIIVDYMVRETIGEKIYALSTLFLNTRRDLLNSYQSAINRKEKDTLAILIEEELINYTQNNILKLSILDPAMGSGHFLVNSANYISNFITSFLNQFNIIANLINTSTAYWRRLVVENCLFGVDLNPLAVELSKLSLWILSMAINSPLSFLNHHLKQGNSLVGTRLQEVGTFPREELRGSSKQVSYFRNNNKFETDVNHVVQNYYKISHLGTLSLDIIKQKRQLLFEIDNLLQPYKTICDFHIETCLNSNIKEFDYYIVIENKTIPIGFKPRYSNYFHWELEFPDVLLFSEGFDVIITNPPYLGESGNRDVFEVIKGGSMRKYYLGKMDLFYFFFHLAIDNSNKNAEIALITTNYFITADGALKLRTDIKEKTSIKKIINFNELKVFDSATGQHNMITILTKGDQGRSQVETRITQNIGNASHDLLLSILYSRDPLTKYNIVSQREIFDGAKNYIRFQYADINQNILGKMSKFGELLSTECDIFQGVVSGANVISQQHLHNYSINAELGEGIFILSKEEINELHLSDSERNFIKPWYKNSDIKKWRTSLTTDKYILYFDRNTKSISDIFMNHLSRYKPILDDRREVKNGVIEWWQLQWPRNQYIFEGPKIVAPMRSNKNNFGYNEISWYAASDVYFLIPKQQKASLKYIISLLNSKPYYFWLYFKGKRKGEMLELFKSPLSEIPIPQQSFEKQEKFVIIMDAISQAYQEQDALIQKDMICNLEDQLNKMVYELFLFSHAEIEAIEKQYK